ncbi:MAG: right-handed parallel beta-helix repeat-containing protein [Armatimonadota bacterium]
MKISLRTALKVAIVILALGQPAFGTHTMKTLNVNDFGAIPNDGKDDTSAVLAALEECKKAAPVRLVFKKGRYDFFAGSNPKNRGTLFPISGISQLTIDGQGSEFVVHGMTGIFWCENCKDITLSNFLIDWDRPPYSAGKVIEAMNNYFDVEIERDYPVEGGEPVEAFMEYDPATRLPMRYGMEEYYTVEKTELVRKQVLRIHTKHPTRIKPGVLVVLRHKVYGPSAIVCGHCSDLVVRDVTIHTVPGMGFYGGVCTNVTLERFKVVPRPGRPMSSTADATHFAGCKGTITLDSCEFAAMGDDGANIKSGLYLTLRKKLDEHTILASHNLNMVDLPDPGDVMEISHTEDLIPYATAKVRRAELVTTEGSNLHKVEFENKLPADLREGDVFGNSTRVAKLRARNCTVRNNRARGMLIQTRDAIVEHCKFINCTGPGIMVLTEVAHFFESIGTRNVTVKDCLFENCNYGVAIGPGALCAMAFLQNMSYPPKPGVHRNVTFERNTINRCTNSAIFAAGVDGLTVKRNTIRGACENTTTDTGKYAIYVTTSRNVAMSDNTIEKDKQGAKFFDAVRIESSQ